jgi:peptidyl-prolyl cis-trans isomerase C
MRLPIVLILVIGAAHAVQYPLQENAEKKFVSRGTEQLTFADIDASVLNLNPIDRPVFANDYQKLSRAIDQDLLNKQLAAEAQKRGFDQDPVIARAMKRAAEAELAKYTLEIMVDEKLAATDVSALVQEVYIANMDQFKAPLTSTVVQVLISNKGSTEENLAVANEVAAKARAGADFAELVQTYSTDPFKVEDKGIVVVDDPTKIAQSFFDAAHGIPKVGDVTGVIETEYGLHVLKLIDRTPARQRSLEEVRPQIVNQLNADNREQISKELISDLRSAETVYDESAFEELKTRYGRIPIKGVSAPGAAIVLPEMHTVKSKTASKPE